MELPEYVRSLIARLEDAGHPAYAVGGCVRDALLGLTPHDYDLCTAATPEQTKAIFRDYPMFLAGEKHGTVSIVAECHVVEITTFRTESGYADHRHPDRVEFVPRIEADLARRDFTVNAMAWSPTRGFADPFGGRADLENRILRAVGDPRTRFQEDSLRILRGVRFAARYRLAPEPETEAAMSELAPGMDTLARERVFDELCKLLLWVAAQDLLRFHNILCQVIPELAPTVGFDQRTPHHAFDVFTHTAHVTEAVPPEPALRWAALLHDVGKPAAFTVDENGQGHFKGHAKFSAEAADAILRRLKAPTALRERVVFLIAHHMDYLLPDRALLRRRLSRCGEEALWQLLALQKADFCSKGVVGRDQHFPETEALIRQILAENACLSVKDLAVNGRDLMALGFSGPAIGQCLSALLDQVVEETLPNQRGALLDAARNFPGSH